MGNPSITAEQALAEAIACEKRIRDLYREAAERAADPVARKVFTALGDDEQGHVDYLEHRLRELAATGSVSPEAVPTVFPDPAAFECMKVRVEKGLDRDYRRDEKQVLSRALEAEVETSAFYRRMAEEVPGVLGEVFARFLVIEDGHIAAVQAELDYLSNTGFWFDIQEFDMEH